MRRLLLTLLLAGCQALVADVPEFYNLPRAGNVYFDTQGCRYVGEAKLQAGVSLYRLCPGVETVSIGWIPLSDSFLNKVEEGSQLHFFDDEDYPVWIQPVSGPPYSLINIPSTDSHEFARLVSSLGHAENNHFGALLWRWFDNHSGWDRTIAKSSQYALIDALFILPIFLQPQTYNDLTAVWDGIKKINSLNARRGQEHVAGIWNALEVVVGGALEECMTAEGLFSIGYDAVDVMKDELIFRFGAQRGISAGLAYLLPEVDDWPARQRFLSRTSKLASSSLLAASSLYFMPDRSWWLFSRFFLKSYLLSGELYERFGLAGSLIEASLINGAVMGFVSSSKRLLLYMGKVRY